MVHCNHLGTGSTTRASEGKAIFGSCGHCSTTGPLPGAPSQWGPRGEEDEEGLETIRGKCQFISWNTFMRPSSDFTPSHMPDPKAVVSLVPPSQGSKLSKSTSYLPGAQDCAQNCSLLAALEGLKDSLVDFGNKCGAKRVLRVSLQVCICSAADPHPQVPWQGPSMCFPTPNSC